MDIVEHLKKFLAGQGGQDAAVPGLGVFYEGEKNGSVCILFKEVSPTDKSFLNFVAFEENVGVEEARSEMEKWVRGILQELKSKGSVYIPGVGSFVITGERVDYVPMPREKNEAEDFGLDGGLAPLVSEEQKPEPVVPEPDELPVASAASNEASGVVPASNRPPMRPEKGNNPAERPDNKGSRNIRPGGGSIRPAEGSTRLSDNNARFGNNKFQGKNTPRPIPNPANNNRNRPVPGPANPGKGIVLDNARQGMKKPGRKVSQPARKNIFTQWWFLLACFIVVLLIVLFAIRPVRESLMGTPRATEMESLRPTDSVIAENVDWMLEEAAVPESGEGMTEAERIQAAENERITQEVIAGEVQRQEAKAASKAASRPAAKPAESKKPSKAKTQDPAKQVSKPATKPAAQVFSAQKPLAGKFYIVVGSFSSENNARNLFSKLQSQGFTPSVLYIQAKKLYYVSVKTCDNREGAIEARTYFRDQKKMDCWIFAN